MGNPNDAPHRRKQTAHHLPGTAVAGASLLPTVISLSFTDGRAGSGLGFLASLIAVALMWVPEHGGGSPPGANLPDSRHRIREYRFRNKPRRACRGVRWK